MKKQLSVKPHSTENEKKLPSDEEVLPAGTRWVHIWYEPKDVCNFWGPFIMVLCFIILLTQLLK